MPPVNYDIVLYPSTDPAKRVFKKFKDVRDVLVEFRDALHTHFVEEEKACEPDDVRDIGFDVTRAKALMLDAKEFIAKAAKAKVTADLRVQGGIDKLGNLVISVVDAHPELFSQSAIVRKEFVQTVVKLFRKTKNVVANLEPDLEEKVIKNATIRQAAKFGVEDIQQGADAVDVGGIKFGNIILAAHGNKLETSGTIIGTHLGQKTPEQIVALLTENKDEAKRLSPKFKGTIVLSGCFTAAGNAVIPEGYDYSTFADKVKRLLDGKGYSNYLIKGMAGPSITTDKGEKLVRPAQIAAEQDKVKDKLEVDNAITEEKKAKKETQLGLLALQLDKLEKELKDTNDEYEAAQDLAKEEPTSAVLKQMSETMEKKLAELRPKISVLTKHFEAKDAKIDKLKEKLAKRTQKMKQLFAEMDSVRTADGVLTFGERRL